MKFTDLNTGDFVRMVSNGEPRSKFIVLEIEICGDGGRIKN